MNQYTKGTLVFTSLFLLTFCIGLYFAISGDASAGRTWIHVSIPLGYAAILWEIGTWVLNKIRKMQVNRNGPTILR